MRLGRSRTQSRPFAWRAPLRWIAPLSIAAVFLARTSAHAQRPAPSHLVLPTSDAADRIRLRQLAGDTTNVLSYMLRSPSSIGLHPADSIVQHGAVLWMAPQFNVIVNSAIPYSMNDGALWAGRGVSGRVMGGFVGVHGPFRLVIAPEIWGTSNAQFDFNRDWMKFHLPSPPVERYGGGFANPWYVAPFSADVPWRFGARPIAHVAPGQTGIWVNARVVEVGVTAENAWWGPGIRNAIVMSDNAAGVPRLELRSPHPQHTRIGDFEWRWFSGALTESRFFDTDSTNDVRSLAAIGLAWRPTFAPTLTLGAARAVYGTVSGYGMTPFRFLDVFAATSRGAPAAPGTPAAAPIDSALHPGGRAQMISLFGRWLFPADGFEAYGEWARQNLPRSPADFLRAPSYTHGYTLGFQWRRPAPADATTFRIQGEVTTLEQSAGFGGRELDVFYTSRRVIQGYTQVGQVIGAAIGPGASSQWLALDRVSPRGLLGITLSRVRWNEDVRSTYDWPAFVAYCNHDVSLLPGLRGGRALGGGYLSGELIVGTRLNAFFQNQSGCPTGGPSRIDEHNTTLSLSFTPFAL